MSLLFRKLVLQNVKSVPSRITEVRYLSFVPSVYDDKDPGPIFISPNVQNILKRLTRPDFERVFRKRTNNNERLLRTPRYKFLTDEELDEEIAKARQRADRLLQMPPVVKLQSHITEELSKDPALIGYDTSKYLFTDISYGVPSERRFIVERDTDGTLRSCDHDVRKRLNQVYFPLTGRKLREPLMFTDADKLAALLARGRHEFVLERACVQYDPDELRYQTVASLVYQHLDDGGQYDLLRSTRHFGPLVFYLSWHGSAERLLLELLQSAQAREAALLVALRAELRGETSARPLVDEIMATPILLTKQATLSEADVRLDSRCVELLEPHIAASALRGPLELALQGYREAYRAQPGRERGAAGQ